MTGAGGHSVMDLRLQEVAVGVLRGVSLTIGSGEVTCLSGPSGSGKSRLLRAVADLDPHDGRIFLGEDEQNAMPANRWREQVIMVPADSQWWYDAVGDHGVDRDDAMIDRVPGMGREVLDWPVNRLSSGERQRLALWRALVRNPRALLLDEPTANLDDDMAEAVERWLLDEIHRRQIAVLWVAHDRAQIHRVADHHLAICGSALEARDAGD